MSRWPWSWSLLGSVAADHADDAADAAGDDPVVERPVAAPVGAAEQVGDRLGGEARDHVHLVVRDHHPRPVAPGEAGDRPADDLPGRLRRTLVRDDDGCGAGEVGAGSRWR